MQVNNSTSPNFGKLMIKKTPEAEVVLKNQSKEVLNGLKEAGQQIKNTKFFHLLVDEKGYLALRSEKGAYFGPFISQIFKSNGKTGSDINTVLIGDSFGIHQLNSVDENGLVKYNVWGYAGSVLDSIASAPSFCKIVLDLDQAAIKDYEKKQAALEAEKQYQKEVDSKVGELFDSFGV